MKYRFFPYSRSGAGASTVTGQTNARGRPTAEVPLLAELLETGGGVRRADHTQSYTVLGPGDVTGFDPSQVILTSPRADTHNMEPNYLVHIEFAHPELPWMFTPEGPDGNHLRPWIALVVVEEDEDSPEPRVRPGEPRVRPGSPNPVLEADVTKDRLPDLNESWAWAHAQMVEPDGAPEGTLENWEAEPGRALSRLLCPRKLSENKSYIACVVPTFESGRQAGLGVGPTKGGQPAWKASGSVTLPVFYHWRFKTGPAGDFETLAQKLQGVKPDKLRDIDVGLRWVHLDAALSRMGASGSFSAQKVPVLTAIALNPRPGQLSPIAENPHPDRTKISGRVKFLIDFQWRSRLSGSDDLIVGPPIYGQWHAERRSVDDKPETADDASGTAEVVMPDATGWVTELNTDVELRAVAAVGTRIVRNDQEELMARAWEQLQAVAEANRRARWGQLYQAATRILHKDRVSRHSLGSLLRLASPALGRFPASLALRDNPADATTSVASVLQTTSLPTTVVGANFSRAARFTAKFLTAKDRPSTTQMLDSVVSPMLTSRFHAASQEQLSAVASRLRPSQFGELLKSADVAARVAESTGLTIDEHVSRLNNLPDLIRTTANRVAAPPQPDPRPEPQQRLEPSILIEVDLDPQGRRRLPVIARSVLEQHSGPISERVKKELGNLTTEPAAQQPLEISPDALALLNANQLVAVEIADEVIDIRKQRFSISSVEHRALQRVLESSQVGAESASSLTRYASVRSATLAQFNVDEPIAAWATADRAIDTIGRYITATEGTEERLTTPDRHNDLSKNARAVVSLSATRDLVVSRLDPSVQYNKMLKWALKIATGGPGRPRQQRTPSHQIMASPVFVDPVVERVKRIDQQWVLGNAEKLPLNSISLLTANARFVEALLVGANYEMAREMQWRRYPTDLMGTCFARFWPRRPGPPDDIEPIALWDRKLGEHKPDNDPRRREDVVVVVVRGDLLRRYPNTIISVVRGQVITAEDGARFVREPGVEPIRELFPRGFLDPDITYAGLAVTLKEGEKSALSKLKDPSGAPNFWFIALTQPADEPRFGLDDNPRHDNPDHHNPKGTPVETLNELSWQSLPDDAKAGEQLHAGIVVPSQGENWTMEEGETKKVKWGPNSDSGQIAAILLQLPFQLLLKASDYV